MQPFNKNKAHALMVGVGQRPGEDKNPNLAITADDAKMIGEELLDRAPFSKDKMHYLLNDAATTGNLLAKLDELATATKNDRAEMVVVYFSGHGMKPKSADKYYLVCRDTLNDTYDQTGIPMSVFVEKLEAIETDKMLVLLDCCHSGGMYTDDTHTPFDGNLTLRKPNRIVLSASHGAQVSYLSKPISIFTYALVEGLSGKYFAKGDSDVSVFDLAMYVRERVYPLSRNRQQPQLNILKESQTTNFVIARYPNGEVPAPAFSEDFRLLDGEGKSIDTSIDPVRDTAYREQFAWMITGDNNVVIGNVTDSTVTVNTGNTTNQKAEKITNIGSIQNATFD